MKLEDLKVLTDNSDKERLSQDIKIGKNQIYREDNIFVVEKYEYSDDNGVDYFSVIDGYEDIEVAIRSAKTGLHIK